MKAFWRERGSALQECSRGLKSGHPAFAMSSAEGPGLAGHVGVEAHTLATSCASNDEPSLRTVAGGRGSGHSGCVCT